jgi:hypothetical protein
LQEPWNEMMDEMVPFIDGELEIFLLFGEFSEADK